MDNYKERYLCLKKIIDKMYIFFVYFKYAIYHSCIYIKNKVNNTLALFNQVVIYLSTKLRIINTGTKYKNKK